MSFEELLKKGFPQGFAILDLNKNVPELLKGNLDEVIPFSKAFTALGARIVREHKEGFDKKMPSRGQVTLKDGEVVITLGGWREVIPLPPDNGGNRDHE
jgi:hypothetical protein